MVLPGQAGAVILVTPWLESMAAMEQHALSLGDFAIHDDDRLAATQRITDIDPSPATNRQVAFYIHIPHKSSSAVTQEIPSQVHITHNPGV